MGYPKGVKRCGVVYPLAKEDPTTGQEHIVPVKCRFSVPCKVHEGTNAAILDQGQEKFAGALETLASS